LNHYCAQAPDLESAPTFSTVSTLSRLRVLHQNSTCDPSEVRGGSLGPGRLPVGASIAAHDLMQLVDCAFLVELLDKSIVHQLVDVDVEDARIMK
jgi:hypothetical protein